MLFHISFFEIVGGRGRRKPEEKKANPSRNARRPAKSKKKAAKRGK